MALTMTRTRTQTALTKLAELVANVHGELAFLEGLLIGSGAAEPNSPTPEVRVRLEARLQKLMADRDALYTTICQFDAQLVPSQIVAADAWRKRFGTGNLRARTLVARYLATLLRPS